MSAESPDRAKKHSTRIFEEAHAHIAPSEYDEKQHAHFERQWNDTTTTEIEGKKFAIHSVHPEHSISAVPVAFFPGWTDSAAKLEKGIEEMVACGRTSMTINAAHGAQHSIVPPDHLAHIADAELRRIAAYMHMLDTPDRKTQEVYEKVDGVGYSEGGMDLLIAAAMHPERFRTIVLVNPAGFIADDKLTQKGDLSAIVGLAQTHEYSGFAARAISSAPYIDKALKEAGTAEQRARAKTMDWEFWMTFLRAPHHSAREVLSMSRTQVAYLLREVKANGVNVIIVHSAEDKIFPPLRVGASISAEKVSPEEDITNIVDGVYVIGDASDDRTEASQAIAGGHTNFVINAPEVSRVANAALTAIELRDSNT